MVCFLRSVEGEPEVCARRDVGAGVPHERCGENVPDMIAITPAVTGDRPIPAGHGSIGKDYWSATGLLI
jgi:hypothetical protein